MPHAGKRLRCSSRGGKRISTCSRMAHPPDAPAGVLGQAANRLLTALVAKKRQYFVLRPRWAVRAGQSARWHAARSVPWGDGIESERH